MHRFIIATAVLLLAPATALAVVTQQAQPPTIAFRRRRSAEMPKLPYTNFKLALKVILASPALRPRPRRL